MKIRILVGALVFGLMMGVGSKTFAQTNLSAQLNDPVNVTVPYINYNGITDKDKAMKAWARANPTACQTYVTQVTTVIRGLNMASLTPQEAYYVKRRRYECEKLMKIVANN